MGYIMRIHVQQLQETDALFYLHELLEFEPDEAIHYVIALIHNHFQCERWQTQIPFISPTEVAMLELCEGMLALRGLLREMVAP